MTLNTIAEKFDTSGSRLFYRPEVKKAVFSVVSGYC